jgi:hypothetical protein
MGLLHFFIQHPTRCCALSVRDATDDCLAARMNMDVFDADDLFAATPQFRECLSLGAVKVRKSFTARLPAQSAWGICSALRARANNSIASECVMAV